jgi:hypothetical protein
MEPIRQPQLLDMAPGVKTVCGGNALYVLTLPKSD